MLFAATFVMGMGIAFMQPALPTIVRTRLPTRIALGTTVYSNGLLVGEALPASLTLPFVLPALGGSWRASLVAWSVPVALVLIAALPAALARRAPAHAREPVRWWPDWRSPQVWALGVVSGATSALYYCLNAFLPDFLRQTGRGDLIGAALSALNWAQIPASFLLLAFSARLVGRPRPIVLLGAVSLASLAALVAMPGAWVVVWSGVVGFVTAFVLILTLALPALLAAPADVHRVSAAMFAIGYLCALVVPVLGGALWDLTGIPAIAFLPAALMAAGMVMAPSWLSLERPGSSRTA
jgi:CP family cyanate transporter-like MFS transporter